MFHCALSCMTPSKAEDKGGSVAFIPPQEDRHSLNPLHIPNPAFNVLIFNANVPPALFALPTPLYPSFHQETLVHLISAHAKPFEATSLPGTMTASSFSVSFSLNGCSHEKLFRGLSLTADFTAQCLFVLPRCENMHFWLACSR